MSSLFKCPHCGCAYHLDASSADKARACRQCGADNSTPRGATHTGSLRAASPMLRAVGKVQIPALFPPPTPFLAQISRHIERTVGPSPMVFHEVIAGDIHLGLHVIPPQSGAPSPDFPQGRNFYTLVTSGLSTRPMTLPPDAGDHAPRHAELMITLPPNWPGLRPDGTFGPELLQDEANAWPLRWLKTIARLPHEYDVFIGAGRTFDGAPATHAFDSDSNFQCMLAAPSVVHPRSTQLFIHDDLSVAFLALWPLYRQEREFAQQQGIESLMQRFELTGITNLIDDRRKNVAR